MASMVLKLLLPLAIMLPLVVPSADAADGLDVGFYAKTCPKAEFIIGEEIAKALKVAPSLPGPLLRLHFHDCFVNGCDGSVLLNATDGFAEKNAPPNLSLRGFGLIDRIKEKLEKACPGIVSCSDILAVVARDVVYWSKGPRWEVPLGRRDGRRSRAWDCFGNLPPAAADMNMLKAIFNKKGLNSKDIAVLSGGHTIGKSFCSSFSSRLYNFTGKGDVDPSLDKHYVPRLKSKCKPDDLITRVEMDPGSYKTFDSSYYKLILKRRALFNSDEALLLDAETKAYVETYAKGSPAQFFEDFAESMVKMGSIEVLTGNKGEIRKHCALVN